MSNRLTIMPTKFTNSRSGEVSCGFRAYDDHGQCYDNTMESIPDDDLEFLEEVLELGKYNETFNAMIDFIMEHERGLSIGDVWYDYSEIKELLVNYNQ